jgi:LysR family glycine cleavage system transcriptional activator
MSRRLPPLNALRAFEAAARQRSFARAAEELHVTPAAVSQQIRQLEEYLGLRLFRRGRALELCDAAQAVLPLLSEGFDQLERAAARLRAGSQDGPLVISAPPTFAARWLIPRLDDFQARHPEIELRLHASRRLVDFDLEDVDAAIRFGSGPFAGLHAERLMPEAVVPVASRAVAAKIQRPADLLQITLLDDESHSWDPAFPDWETWLASLNVAGNLRIRHFGDASLVSQAAEAGLGVALVWYSLVADALRDGRLVRLFGSTLPTHHGYHIVYPPNRAHLPKVAAFSQWMLEKAREQSAP